MDRGAVGRALRGGKVTASDLCAKIAFYAVLLFALQLAFGIWGPNAVSDLLTSLIAWLPRAFVAIIIIVVAAAIAGAAHDLIAGALGGLTYGRLLARAASVLIITLGVIAALDQVRIATAVTQPLLIAVLATVAGVLIVGVGGGLVRPMQQRWDTWLERPGTESAAIREQARTYAEEKARRRGRGRGGGQGGRGGPAGRGGTARRGGPARRGGAQGRGGPAQGGGGAAGRGGPAGRGEAQGRRGAKAEEARLAEESARGRGSGAAEEARMAEERRQGATKRAAEEVRRAEDERKAELARIAEEKRTADAEGRCGRRWRARAADRKRTRAMRRGTATEADVDSRRQRSSRPCSRGRGHPGHPDQEPKTRRRVTDTAFDLEPIDDRPHMIPGFDRGEADERAYAGPARVAGERRRHPDPAHRAAAEAGPAPPPPALSWPGQRAR